MQAPVAPVRQIDPITALHRHVVALLAPYFDARKWGEVEAITLPLTYDSFRSIAKTTPRLYLGFNAFMAKGTSARMLDGDLSMRLVIVTKAGSAKQPGYFGDRFAPGLYPSLFAAATVLHGRTIADLGSLQVTGVNQGAAEGMADISALVGHVDFKMRASCGDFLGEAAAAPDFVRLISSFEVNAPSDADPGFDMGGDITLPGDPA
ncbi:hypothetical protein [Ancylobacter pratisalsi]|uniref:DUF1834 family protein n=1 Tax=Ancylobacter pratisalsi TaxID=1745854 RepID=A0A6P1YPB6_9HYPH|nr:hypothetical protein [Ancylobacter pratisalsi]QIB34750.1 hypothetical protein G3A50_14320 [Ancylobacter pratisalsi]